MSDAIDKLTFMESDNIALGRGTQLPPCTYSRVASSQCNSLVQLASNYINTYHESSLIIKPFFGVPGGEHEMNRYIQFG
jgi:hypothetical protein